jgi:hypothetical protein
MRMRSLSAQLSFTLIISARSSSACVMSLVERIGLRAMGASFSSFLPPAEFSVSIVGKPGAPVAFSLPSGLAYQFNHETKSARLLVASETNFCFEAVDLASGLFGGGELCESTRMLIQPSHSMQEW